MNDHLTPEESSLLERAKQSHRSQGFARDCVIGLLDSLAAERSAHAGCRDCLKEALGSIARWQNRAETLERHKAKLIEELGRMLVHFGPDPETRRECLEAMERGEFISSEEFLKQLRQRAAADT